MKKLIKTILILLFTSIISYAAVICIALALHINGWFPDNKILSGEGFTLLKTREIKKYSSIDVLFLGSSHVYRGVDTRLFERSGIKAFNFGTSSQSPYNSYFLLKEYMSVVKPKYVVLDLFWGVSYGDGTESTIDLISNHELTSTIIKMAVRTHNMVTIRNLVAVSLSRLFKPLKTIEVKQESLHADIYNLGGFVASGYNDTEKYKQEFGHVNSKIQPPAHIQLEYINKIIALCKASNAKLMFILVPVTKEFKNKLNNYKEYTNAISDIANKNNIVFIDYNENRKLSLSWTNDYTDFHHLNTDGAQKFTKLLLNDFNAFLYEKQDTIASH
ncbi:DUF1574 family protein [Segetibacter koreensis]|uniref:DUF1574 family protein n=1 Tax=Segetibacter koreensis TaxID=398037 RepID=UPI0003621C84|nr:DUF1574 family protein [Segetibacter koreensis]